MEKNDPERLDVRGSRAVRRDLEGGVMQELVRDAEPSDAEALAALNRELGYEATPEEMAARVARVREQGDAVLVAEVGGEVAGWVHVATFWAMESGAMAEIRGLVVTERRRSGGIGARLVRAAEELTLAHGLKQLRVRTNVVRERAHAFYEREGFTLRKMQRVYEKQL